MAGVALRVHSGGLASAGAASPPPLRLPALGPDEGALLDRLRAEGAVRASALFDARAARLARGVPVADSLLAAGALDEPALLDVWAAALGWGRAADTCTADAGLVDRAGGAACCLARGFVPLGRAGSAAVIAVARPGTARALAAALEARLGPVRFVLAPAASIEDALLAICRPQLIRRAEVTVPAAESCRGWPERRLAAAGLAAAAILAAPLALAPVATLALATGLTLAALVLASLLKTAALFAALRRPSAPPAFRSRRRTQHLRPFVSVLVPLYREREIADRLVRRLWALDYPRERLEICLVLEEDDEVTRAALTRAPLPGWFRLVEVPRGAVKTKPRALNYALPFCRGEIVGIYDAEDAPDPDQLLRVADRFAAAPPEVVCLQGALDFYNASDNWLSRCFAIEYASWFRVMLPGLARLGLVVPLGGTTLFFRRRALEELGGWDAHNVTEDADLGLRLARHGYRTELIDTTTAEEANNRAWPWIRQRSRWLKGYAMTWAAHMRAPRRLWRDLGPWRFLGVQVLFLGALVPYAGAPLLWSFWAVPLGLPHPLAPLLGPAGLAAFGLLFLACEVLNLTVGIIGCRLARRPRLGWWTPTLHLYFPLGALAAWKGLTEIATRPYYWDKTRHGFSGETAEHEG